MSRPVWIVEGKLDFTHIIGNESAYIDAWNTIVKHWLFEPANHLLFGEKIIDRGIALLTLELAFFEPFGSVLTGKDSDNTSHATFSEGLAYFSNWLLSEGLISEKENTVLSVIGTRTAPNMVYSYARCGLMHKMTMQGGRIFIDALKTGEYAITDYNYAINSRHKDGTVENNNIFLIDPWRLLPLIERFFAYFIRKLKAARYNEGDLYSKFKTTFERSIVDPGKVYLDLIQ